MASSDQEHKGQAAGVVQSAKEVLGGEERQEDKEELTSQDFSEAGTKLQASDALKAVKDKVVPTARAAGGPDQEEPAAAGSGIGQLRDAIGNAGKAVADRFTAPASGTGKEETGAGGAGLSKAAQDAKDKASGGASYIADRFTASPSGDKGKSAGQSAEEGKDKAGGFLSGILPKSNEGESKGSDGKSLGDKAQDKYDSAKAEVNKQEDKISDQITPKTQEEADLSSGYIPSSTAAESK